jgi:hypothetical protein
VIDPSVDDPRSDNGTPKLLTKHPNKNRLSIAFSVEGNSGMDGSDDSTYLFATVTIEVKGKYAFVVRGALKHFRMAQSENGVVIASTPVLLHAGARELVVL